MEDIAEFNIALANIARALNIINVYADELLRRDMNEFRQQLIEARKLLWEFLKGR